MTNDNTTDTRKRKEEERTVNAQTHTSETQANDPAATTNRTAKIVSSHNRQHNKDVTSNG